MEKRKIKKKSYFILLTLIIGIIGSIFSMISLICLATLAIGEVISYGIYEGDEDDISSKRKISGVIIQIISLLTFFSYTAWWVLVYSKDI